MTFSTVTHVVPALKSAVLFSFRSSSCGISSFLRSEAQGLLGEGLLTGYTGVESFSFSTSMFETFYSSGLNGRTVKFQFLILKISFRHSRHFPKFEHDISCMKLFSVPQPGLRQCETCKAMIPLSHLLH